MALNYLCINDIDNAHKLFKLNTIDNPTFETFNNYGAFCYKNLRINKSNPAIKLLKCALNYQNNINSNIILGDIYLENNKYKKSCIYYKKAIDISKSPIACNNYAISLFYQKKYDQAIYWFNQSYETIDEELKSVPLSSEIATLIIIGNKNQASIKFNLLINLINEEEIDFSLLHLAYGCDRNDFILENCFKVLNGWFISINDFKCIINSFVLSKKNDLARKFNDEVIKTIDGYDFLSEKQRKQYNIAYDRAIMSKRYKKIIYTPELLPHNYYYNL